VFPEDQDDQIDDGKPKAPGMIARALQFNSSMSSYVSDYEWREPRNMHEGRVLAQGIDYLICNDINNALEVFTRRLAGIQMADRRNDWSLCEAIEVPTNNSSLLSERDLRAAYKDANNIRRLRASSFSTSDSRRYSSRRGRGGRKSPPPAQPPFFGGRRQGPPPPGGSPLK
jgi:hypothetical protein